MQQVALSDLYACHSLDDNFETALPIDLKFGGVRDKGLFVKTCKFRRSSFIRDREIIV